jgi:hypothetical protein
MNSPEDRAMLYVFKDLDELARYFSDKAKYHRDLLPTISRKRLREDYKIMAATWESAAHIVAHSNINTLWKPKNDRS